MIYRLKILDDISFEKCDKNYDSQHHKIIALLKNITLELNKKVVDYKKIKMLNKLIKKNSYKIKLETLNLLLNCNYELDNIEFSY